MIVTLPYVKLQIQNKKYNKDKVKMETCSKLITMVIIVKCPMVSGENNMPSEDLQDLH